MRGLLFPIRAEAQIWWAAVTVLSHQPRAGQGRVFQTEGYGHSKCPGELLHKASAST